MPYGTTREQENQRIIENMQEFYTAILEYYDELFPLDEAALSFLLNLQQDQKTRSKMQPAPMCRYLGIGCATGNLENRLVNNGMDVTGIDQNPDMIETAKRRMKRGFSTIRFFEMSAIDIRRFLKKGSFNIIGCLGNILPFITDETLLRKFFHDTRDLLAPNGKLIIETLNYNNMTTTHPVRLPDRSSVRVTLSRGYIPLENGQVLLDATLELGNGKKLVLQRTTVMQPLPTDKIESCAREEGFTAVSFYGDFSGSAWTENSPTTIIILE